MLYQSILRLHQYILSYRLPGTTCDIELSQNALQLVPSCKAIMRDVYEVGKMKKGCGRQGVGEG